MPGLVAFVYSMGHLSWYLDTALGQVPVLDEREHLAMAEAIFRGTLPSEPFYRAPGYALLLSIFRVFGASQAHLFPIALAFGALLHTGNAILIAYITRGCFNARAGVIAGLLFAIYPVFVHYSTQALDAVPALTFFLLGLACLTPVLTSNEKPSASVGYWLGASLCWSVATIIRPNYVVVWLLLPVLATLFAGSNRWRAISAALGGAALFAALAGWQFRISGVPGILPTQGAYNLWASNRPGSNGRFFTQHISLTGLSVAENPARVESLVLFEEETGHAPSGLAEANDYWRRQFFSYVMHHPAQWLSLVGRKLYALFNDWEQYNNKTFAFHAARSPWLSWNPFSWGVLFILAGAGAARLTHENSHGASAFAMITVSVVVSILLFFVSARFRLPLAALAMIGAGGALAAPAFWRSWPASRRIGLGAGLLVAGLLTFSSFDHVRDRSTFVQDHALLARAAATTGDDSQAWTEAEAALALQPEHPDALRIAVASYFNLLLIGAAAPVEEARWERACEQLLAGSSADAPDLRAIAALAYWRSGEKDVAIAEWRRLGQTPSALAARIMIKDAVNGSALTRLPAGAWNFPLVQLAAAVSGIAPPPKQAPSAFVDAANVAKRLFTSRNLGALQ